MFASRLLFHQSEVNIDFAKTWGEWEFKVKNCRVEALIY